MSHGSRIDKKSPRSTPGEIRRSTHVYDVINGVDDALVTGKHHVGLRAEGAAITSVAGTCRPRKHIGFCLEEDQSFFADRICRHEIS